MGEIEERLVRHAAALEQDATPLTEQEVIGRERRPGPIARPLAVLAAAVIALVAIGVPALFFFTGEPDSGSPSTSVPATTVPEVVAPTLPDPATTVPGPPTTGPGPVVDPESRLVRGAPVVAVGVDDSFLIAYFETAIGAGLGGVGFNDGRDFSGGPQATTIVFRICTDPACSAITSEGRVPAAPWSDTLSVALGPEGLPWFAYWDWGGVEFGGSDEGGNPVGDFADGGTRVVECHDPMCREFTDAYLTGPTPGPVRVASGASGEPVAVLMSGMSADIEGTSGVLSVSRGYGQSASLGLPPSRNWPYPDLAVGPDDRPVVVVNWDDNNDSPDTAGLLMLVCSDPSCEGETIQTTLARWSGLWKPVDVAGIVNGPAGDIRVPFAFWDEGCPRCFTNMDWAEPWSGNIRIATCETPECADPAIETVATVPGLLGMIGAGAAPDGRTIVGWTACPEMVSGLSLNGACPEMHAVVAACNATSCEEFADLPIGNPGLSYLVGMTVTPGGTPIFHWVETGVVQFESGGIVHVAACDEPECGTITDRVIAP
jgi:hypothetical protein